MAKDDHAERFNGLDNRLNSHEDRLDKLEGWRENAFKLTADEWGRMQNKYETLEEKTQNNTTGIAVNNARYGWIVAMFAATIVLILGLYAKTGLGL